MYVMQLVLDGELLDALRQHGILLLNGEERFNFLRHCKPPKCNSIYAYNESITKEDYTRGSNRSQRRPKHDKFPSPKG